MPNPAPVAAAANRKLQRLCATLSFFYQACKSDRGKTCVINFILSMKLDQRGIISVNPTARRRSCPFLFTDKPGCSCGGRMTFQTIHFSLSDLHSRTCTQGGGVELQTGSKQTQVTSELVLVCFVCLSTRCLKRLAMDFSSIFCGTGTWREDFFFTFSLSLTQRKQLCLDEK